MAKTSLINILKKAYRLAQFSEQPNTPGIDEISEWYQTQQRKNWSRRSFLGTSFQAGIAIGGTSLLGGYGMFKPGQSFDTSARVVIIGAGIAGLHAGHCLKKGGLPGTALQIYEASNRTGGRMFTSKLFGNDMTTELGGEFTDSDHKDILDLANQFNIPILDKESDNLLIGDAYFFNGQHYTLGDVVKAFQSCRKKIGKDAKSLGKNYDTPLCESLDRTTLKAYLDGLEADTWFKKMLEVAYVGEYGRATEEQSALNLIDMIATKKKGFKIFGDSDERYKLQGGNQQICDRLADGLKENIQLGHSLVAVKNKGQGFVLSFAAGGSTKEVETDFVIMTIPYTVLRNVEGIDKLTGITPQKLKCIQELGYGLNGKIFLGLNNRPWRSNQPAYQGYIYTENIHTGWDSYHLQQQNQGPSVFTIFLGDMAGATVAPQKAASFVPELGKAFPGFQSAFLPSQTAAMNWTTNPFQKGSYACYKPGQWTDVSGQEGESIGNMLFAGEHCSVDFQGYMNGAAETGRIAAEQILAKVKK
ncbi:flavin monoamine oxidase family protein [Haliscomenobacter sp.]|uniref:flavin monoamine oxidase family protein n=1 Tax=Haliscomenobacter sp. TaxID=2717303 RepID=UPI0035936A87